MNLYIYTGATDLTEAAVTAANNLTAVTEFPALVYGDTEPLAIRFTTDANGTQPSWANVAGHVIDVTVGELGSTGAERYAATSNFTYADNTYSGTIYLGTPGFASWVASRRNGKGWLDMQIRHTDTDGEIETLAVLTCPAWGSVPGGSSAETTPVSYATYSDVVASQTAAAGSATSAAASAAAALVSAASAAEAAENATADAMLRQPGRGFSSSLSDSGATERSIPSVDVTLGASSTYSLATSSVLAAVNLIALPKGAVKEVKIDINSVGSGALNLLLLRMEYDGTITVEESATISVGGTGLQTFTGGGVDFPAWNVGELLFVGIQTVTGGATVYYRTTGGAGYTAKSGTASGNEVWTNNNTGEIYVQVVVTKTVEVEYLDTETVALETVSDFGSLPSGWSNGGSTWTFGSSKATSGTVGVSNQLRTDKSYGLARRLIRWEFEITTSTSNIAFLTNPIESAGGNGSMVQIDASGSRVIICYRYTGSGTPTGLASQALGFTMATATRYCVEIEKNARTMTVRLWDKAGTSYAEFSRTSSPNGYTVYPSSTAQDQGALYGAPGVAVIAGGVELYSFSHRAIGTQRPTVYAIGDSITEGFGVDDDERYAHLIEQYLGEKQVMASGLGGATTAGARVRFESELQYIRPKYLLIFLGSNTDASFTANMTQMINVGRMLGCVVAVCTIPTNSTYTNVITGYPSAWGLKVINMKLALYSGSTVIASYYTNTDAAGTAYNDLVHPNAAGHAKMFQRILLDAP